MDRRHPLADGGRSNRVGGVTAASVSGETAGGLLADDAATERCGAALAEALSPGDVVFLIGEMGAGKSSLARALIRTRLTAEGRADDIPSPTYTLVQTYDLHAGSIVHADLYRLSADGGEAEAEELGLFDDDGAIVLIEWPDRLGSLTPQRRLDIALSIPTDAVGRRLEAIGYDAGEKGWSTALAAIKTETDVDRDANSDPIPTPGGQRPVSR